MKAILMSCNNCNREYAFKDVSKYIQPGMKVLCVPFASDLHWQLQGDFTDYKNQHFSVFKCFGIADEDIDILSINDDEETMNSKIINSDIVFFSGGFMENAMFLLEKLDVNILTYFKRNDKLIMGESAGALILQDEYIEVPYIEEAYKVYREKLGLGLVDRYNLIVHYDKNNPKHRENKEYVKLLNNKLTVCLTDESLMIIDDNMTYLIGDFEL